MCLQPTLSTPAVQQENAPAPACAAKALLPQQRQELAVQALAGAYTISQLAEDFDVSRKFIYQQTAKAEQALDRAFDCDGTADDEVLFYLPVTKPWLKQFVLALVLIGHCSLRGVTEVLRDVFDYLLSVGTVHNIVASVVDKARQQNSRHDLVHVRIGAHDEIFQNGQPVLVGADVDSTFCYLLSIEDHRDADTWGIRLLELQDHGFRPQAVIADFGSGLRAGHDLALPHIPCRGDVFHALHELKPVVAYLENRAYDVIGVRTKLEGKLAHHRRRHGRSSATLAQQLRHARPAEVQAVGLADDVALLVQWFQEDIWTVAGPAAADRAVLYDFVVAELRARAPLCPHRLEPLCRFLENHRAELLAFAVQLDQDLTALGTEFQVSAAVLRQLLNVQAMNARDPRRWQQDTALRGQLRSRYHLLSEAVADLARATVRASSVIENFNSRLRNYFFLRRQLGPDYLALLQFFLNHRRFLRSEHPDRVDQSPAELLTGRRHPHWLEMLGFERFRQN
jgi:hypothetical protein